MASQSSDPEKYSIDEMMERLKAKAPEDPSSAGQLVIRDDGTSAIRVRKRKRRTSQPKKEEAKRGRRAMIFQISAILVLLILSALAIGGGIVFANSVPFRNSLLGKVSASTGAEVDLELFRMNPTTAYANSITLDWPEGNVLGSLTLRTVKAEIFPSSFLGKSFNGEEVTAREGTLQLHAAGEESAAAVARPDEASRITFNRYGITNLDVLFGDPAAAAAGRLTGTEASFYAGSVSGHPQLRLNRGELAIHDWPTLRLERALIEFRGREMGIVGLRLSSEADRRGLLEIAGTVHPFEPQSASTLKLSADAFPLAGIVGPSLGSLIAGRIDTNPEANANVLSFAPGADPAATMVLSFRSSLDSAVEMKHFPFLFGLAQTLQDDWFERPVFSDDASGTIRRSAGVVRLGDLALVTKRRMAVRGDIAMDRGGLLTGVLRVGITEAMIESVSPSRLDTLFGAPDEGFRWITLTIGGTADAPTDDFKEQYTAPAGAASEAPAPGSSFEELTRPR